MSLDRQFMALSVVALVSQASMLYAQCEPQWSDRFATRGVVGTINAATTWDDGTGAKVYVAGEFSTFDNIPSIGQERGANSIAAWDGTSWSKLGRGIGGTNSFQSGLRIVHAIAVFDPDGPGPLPESLYVGGEFNWAGGQNIIGIARWDGTNWNDVGGGIFGQGSTLNRRLAVRDMVVFDADGPGPGLAELYIAGDFEFAGSEFVNGVARFDGQQWHAVGGSFQPGTSGRKLVVFDEDGPGPDLATLYLAGRFTQAPNVAEPFLPISAGGLVRWNGVEWIDEPGFHSIDVGVLAAFDDGSSRSLWASGGISLTGGATNPALVRRENGVWMQFGTPNVLPYYSAAEIRQQGDHLYLSGSVPGTSESFVRWSPASPSTFEPLGSALRGGIGKIFPIDFDLAGPDAESLLVTGGDNFARFPALRDAVMGDQAFSNAAVWNGTHFEPTPTSGSGSLGLGVPTNGFPLDVRSLRVLDADGAGPLGESLWMGGVFNGAGPAITGNIASFDGAQFSPYLLWFNTSAPFSVDWFDDQAYPLIEDVTAHDDGTGTRVYAGAAGLVMRLDGTQFAPIGFIDGTARRILSFSDGSQQALWAFGAIGGASPFFGGPGSAITSNGPVSWTPTAGWQDRSAGLPVEGFSIRDATVFDPGTGPTLFVGGFTFNWPTRYLAQWTGTEWDFSPITTVTGDFAIIGSLVSFNGELYAAGSFLSIDGVPAVAIARWNGATWSSLGDGLTDAVNGDPSVRVSSIAVHDDGSGPALFVSGLFTHAGGVPVSGFAKWDGANWSNAGPASANGGFSASALASFDGKLYLGHGTTVWGDYSSSGLTTLEVPCSACPPCAADYDDNGGVDGGDLGAFFADFESGETCADVDQNGGVDGGDLGFFFSVFEAGGC